MPHQNRRLARRTALAALLVTVALTLVPTAFGDLWASDRADAVAMQGLDPAIRTAIGGRSPALPALDDDGSRAGAKVVAAQGLDPAISTAIAARSAAPAPLAPAAATLPRVSPPDDGFAWGAAALGLAAGIAAMCALLACVSLVRHDGRLRNA